LGKVPKDINFRMRALDRTVSMLGLLRVVARMVLADAGSAEDYFGRRIPPLGYRC